MIEQKHVDDFILELKISERHPNTRARTHYIKFLSMLQTSTFALFFFLLLCPKMKNTMLKNGNFICKQWQFFFVNSRKWQLIGTYYTIYELLLKGCVQSPCSLFSSIYLKFLQRANNLVTFDKYMYWIALDSNEGLTNAICMYLIWWWWWTLLIKRFGAREYNFSNSDGMAILW